MTKQLRIDSPEERALERQANELLRRAGCGTDGLKFDLRRQKNLVEYNRRTIYTPCGGLKRKF
jgi:hypothetical protein